jgi:hypothetical protein
MASHSFNRRKTCCFSRPKQAAPTPWRREAIVQKAELFASFETLLASLKRLGG